MSFLTMAAGAAGGLFSGKKTSQKFDKEFLKKLSAYKKGQTTGPGGGRLSFGEKFQKQLKEWDELNSTITRYGRGSVSVSQNQTLNAADRNMEISQRSTKQEQEGESSAIDFLKKNALVIAGLAIGLYSILKPKRKRRRR